MWRRQWHPTPVLLPGKCHGRRSLEGCSPWGRWGSDMTERLHFHFSLSCIGDGNGNPLPCSCLENPRDGGAWWAAVYGVTQSRTRLKRLSSSMLIIRFSPHSISYLLFRISHHFILCASFHIVFSDLFHWKSLQLYNVLYNHFLNFSLMTTFSFGRYFILFFVKCESYFVIVFYCFSMTLIFFLLVFLIV